jgi:porin
LRFIDFSIIPSYFDICRRWLQLEMRIIIIRANYGKDSREEHLCCPVVASVTIEITLGCEGVMMGKLVMLLLAGLAASSAFADAEKMPDWNVQTLSGDWGGARSDLYSKGVILEFTHKSDVLANASGGIKRGAAWMGNTEAGMKINLEKLAGWDATTAYIHYHDQLGSKFNRDYVGSFVGVDNIEVGTNTGQFNHAWIQRSFSGDTLSVLAGLYPIDYEFYVTDTSGIFLQPPYGMANDMAESGKVGPPIFPVGALAVRVKYATPGNAYLQGVLADGVPGDPSERRGTHIRLEDGDGTLSVVELGYAPHVAPSESMGWGGSEEEGEYFNKTAVGFWRYSAHLHDLDPASQSLYPSYGAYFLAERTLSDERKRPTQALSGFIRFGVARKDIHQADWTGSIGLRYHGVIADRDDDIAGVAVTVSHASDKYRYLYNAESSQTAVEATYRAQINPWSAVQPTLQYIANPNMDAALGNAWVVGVRFEVAL